MGTNLISGGGDLTMTFAWVNGPLNIPMSNGTLNGTSYL